MTSPMSPGLEQVLGTLRARIEARLDQLVPPESTRPEVLHRAMRYSLLAPGKRLRPALAILSASVFGAGEELAVDPACAIELVHTASLILDDLPSMDAATLRRGRKANHLVFGEDMAILAAVALLNRAFAVLTAEESHLPVRTRSELVSLLAEAIGSNGVIAGQVADLGSVGKTIDFAELEYIHSRKTGALFIASAETGALLAGLSESKRQPVRAYAKNLGLAFQILDDLADLESSPAETGKDVGQDARKTTFVSFSGPEGARRLAAELIEVAVASLGPFGRRGEILRQLARSLLKPRPA